MYAVFVVWSISKSSIFPWVLTINLTCCNLSWAAMTNRLYNSYWCFSSILFLAYILFFWNVFVPLALTHFPSSTCLQAASCPGRADGSIRGKDVQSVEGGSSHALVGGVGEGGAAQSGCQRPSCGRLPKQVKLASCLPAKLFTRNSEILRFQCLSVFGAILYRHPCVVGESRGTRALQETSIVTSSCLRSKKPPQAFP